jgi:hypothetical protein
MSTNSIFCFGDGYAHGHIWPEWPQILQALLPDVQVTAHTGVGAGNEYLIHSLIQLGDKIANQTVIFQWALPYRFDKLIQDDDWIDRAKQDPIYNFNLYNSDQGTWWLSSASTDKKIQEYHTLFVQKKQAELRFNNQKILVEAYLKSKKCKYLFVSTESQEQFVSSHTAKHLRGTEVQPAPLLHLYYIKEVLDSLLTLDIEAARYDKLENLIKQHPWQAYDPDREEIWQKMSDF